MWAEGSVPSWPAPWASPRASRQVSGLIAEQLICIICRAGRFRACKGRGPQAWPWVRGPPWQAGWQRRTRAPCCPRASPASAYARWRERKQVRSRPDRVGALGVALVRPCMRSLPAPAVTHRATLALPWPYQRATAASPDATVELRQGLLPGLTEEAGVSARDDRSIGNVNGGEVQEGHYSPWQVQRFWR